MKRLLAVVTIVVAGLTTSAAEETVTIKTPSIEPQKTAVWCWASSIQNALAAYGVEVKQEEVVKATYGRVVNLPLFDPRQAVVNLLRANAKVAPERKVVHPFIVAGPPAPAVLVRELALEQSPLLAFYQHAGGGHVVVCYGVEYEDTPVGPLVTKVLVKDPWDGQSKEWPAAQLASLWASTIFLRVAPQPNRQFQVNGHPYIINDTFDVLSAIDGNVHGRVWYFNESRKWHVLDLLGNDHGAIP